MIRSSYDTNLVLHLTQRHHISPSETEHLENTGLEIRHLLEHTGNSNHSRDDLSSDIFPAREGD